MLHTHILVRCKSYFLPLSGVNDVRKNAKHRQELNHSSQAYSSSDQIPEEIIGAGCKTLYSVIRKLVTSTCSLRASTRPIPVTILPLELFFLLLSGCLASSTLWWRQNGPPKLQYTTRIYGVFFGQTSCSTCRKYYDMNFPVDRGLLSLANKQQDSLPVMQKNYHWLLSEDTVKSPF